MQILKHGEKKLRKFVCQTCGCEFVAATHEYWRREYYGVAYYQCDCPECNETSEHSEPWEDNHDS